MRKLYLQNNKYNIIFKRLILYLLIQFVDSLNNHFEYHFNNQPRKFYSLELDYQLLKKSNFIRINRNWQYCFLLIPLSPSLTRTRRLIQTHKYRNEVLG